VIRHVVLFKFKEDTSAEQREQLQAEIRALPQQIDFIRYFELGRDLLRSPRSYDLCLIADFDDLDALQRYAHHPAHVPVVEKANRLCERVAVDFER
jgi:hypothetical protein